MMENYSPEWIREKHSELEIKTKIKKDGDLYLISDINKHLNEYAGDVGWVIGEISLLEIDLRSRQNIKNAWERQAFVRAKSMLKSGVPSSKINWFNKKFGGIEPKPTQKDIDNFVCLRWPRQCKFYERLTEDIEAKLKMLEDYKKIWFKMDDIYKVIGSNIKFEREKFGGDLSRVPMPPSDFNSKMARIHAMMKERGGQ